MGYVMRMKASEGFASTMVLTYSEKKHVYNACNGGWLMLGRI